MNDQPHRVNSFPTKFRSHITHEFQQAPRCLRTPPHPSPGVPWPQITQDLDGLVRGNIWYNDQEVCPTVHRAPQSEAKKLDCRNGHKALAGANLDNLLFFYNGAWAYMKTPSKEAIANHPKVPIGIERNLLKDCAQPFIRW